jgi:hypothetical protein
MAGERTKEDWVDIKVAAKHLGYNGPRAMYMAVRRLGIPHCKFGRAIRFRLSELDAFVELHRRLSLRDSENLAGRRR